MDMNLRQHIIKAEPKERNDLCDKNIFKNIAYDGDKRRLGWIRDIEFSFIRGWLDDISQFLKQFDTFVFVGIGGSGNGVKAVMSFFPDKSVYTIDSLDPAALKDISDKIKDFSKTLVVPISKSGTTKETQLIAGMFKPFFGVDWQKHFMWLTDKPAFDKLDSLGWQGVLKKTIQFDDDTDIGGRFSCPRTAIFILPLFIALDGDMSKLESLYEGFIKLQEKADIRALELAEELRDNNPAFFHAVINGPAKDVAAAWVVQLFQESLGSKRDDLQVKTISGTVNVPDVFELIELDGVDVQTVSGMMAQMYFLQCFVAYFSAYNKLNFVAQDFVEKYKSKMRAMENEVLNENVVIEIDELIKLGVFNNDKKFIDIVLYFYPENNVVESIKKVFADRFQNKLISVYIGSDWNHHSYEAAFNDKNTFFVFLTKEVYSCPDDYEDKSILDNNIATLKLISKATYSTIQDKAVLYSLSNGF